MDDADIAGERIDKYEAEAIKQISKASERSLIAAGFCHNCGEKISGKGMIFCDADCRSDYDYIQARRKANGL